ncbi:ABC transporter permease [Streptomyces sp. NPDC001604]|uniref:ABC transporter permease n=1 Tax=Streptomyces sp. NPDC001604 TaxID=3364593 RepID=UPI0036976AAD
MFAAVCFIRRGDQHSLQPPVGPCGLVGTAAVGIANTTLIAVRERIADFVLRRAVEADAGHITWQFPTESAALGLLGGSVGTRISTAVVVGVSFHNEWPPVLDPWPSARPPFRASPPACSPVRTRPDAQAPPPRSSAHPHERN